MLWEEVSQAGRACSRAQARKFTYRMFLEQAVLQEQGGGCTGEVGGCDWTSVLMEKSLDW